MIIFVVLIVILTTGFFLLLKPKNLGVSYTEKNLESAKNKINVTFENLPNDTPPDKSLTLSGSHPVDNTFSSEELTALVDNRHRDYVYFPFRNAQIRINPDGSVEGSATLTYQAGVDYLLTLGVSQNDIDKASRKFKIPNANIPVYLKVSGNVTNNKSNISVIDAKIANISVPKNLIDEYGPGLNKIVNKVILDRQPSYNVEKLEVVNGQVNFKGTSPDIEKAVKSN
jgi:hypothetical protein